MAQAADQDPARQRFTDHDPLWAQRFEALAPLLRAALPESTVEHYGSTSVPGLGGRPILDVQIAVEDIEDKAAFEPQLEALGYEPFLPPDIARLAPEGLLIYVPSDGTNSVHIAVVERGGAHHRRQLAVRDYLRTHPDEASAYADTKRRAAAAAAGVRVEYARAKADFVIALQDRAVRWAATAAPRRSAPV